MTEAEQRVLDRLREGAAGLAGIRAAFPDDHVRARALPSMGEEDPLGAVLTGLVEQGAVAEAEGVYRLVSPQPSAAPDRDAPGAVRGGS